MSQKIKVKHLVIDKIDNIEYVGQHRVYKMQVKWKNDQQRLGKSIIFIPQCTFYNVSLLPQPTDDNKSLPIYPKQKQTIFQKLDSCSCILDGVNKTLLNEASESKNINQQQQSPHQIHEVKIQQQIIQNSDIKMRQLAKNQIPKSNILTISNIHTMDTQLRINEDQNILDYDKEYRLKQFFKPYIINRNQKLIKQVVKRMSNTIKNKKIKI